METIHIYEVPVREANDIAEIVNCLASQRVFVPGFDARCSDVYNPVTYMEQQTYHDTKTIMVADRNLVSYWVSLAKGIPSMHDGRCAAAIMAFAICADMLIEPNIALYEYAFVKGNDAASDDLCWFGVADNIDISLWLDVALGRKDVIDSQLVEPVSAPKPAGVDFETPLRHWRRNYILCLKLAEIELLGGSNESRLSEFLRWMYDEYLIGLSATLLAAYYLAPNSGRRGLLKAIRSEDRNKAIDGVRNAAWDMTLLTEWAHECMESPRTNEIRILATLDKRLRMLAELIITPIESETSDILSRVLGYWWGEEAGSRILNQLLEYDASRDNPSRQVNQPYEDDFIDDMIRAGEERLRVWKPRR